MAPLHSFNRRLAWGLPRWLSDKESACRCRRHRRCRFDPWAGKIPWRRAWQPTLYSCLENPMDRAAWRAAVHGVEKHQTWLSEHPSQSVSHTEHHLCARCGSWHRGRKGAPGRRDSCSGVGDRDQTDAQVDNQVTNCERSSYRWGTGKSKAEKSIGRGWDEWAT